MFKILFCVGGGTACVVVGWLWDAVCRPPVACFGMPFVQLGPWLVLHRYLSDDRAVGFFPPLLPFFCWFHRSRLEVLYTVLLVFLFSTLEDCGLIWGYSRICAPWG